MLVKSLVEPEILTALVTVTAPLVLPPIALRVVAAIVALLVVKAESVISTNAVEAITELDPLTRVFVN